MHLYMFKCDKARSIISNAKCDKARQMHSYMFRQPTPSILADTKKRKAVTAQTTKQQHKQPICD